MVNSLANVCFEQANLQVFRMLWEEKVQNCHFPVAY